MHIPPPVESVYLDLADRAKLRLTGADRVRFLNGQVSNDVRAASADVRSTRGDDHQRQAVRRCVRSRG